MNAIRQIADGMRYQNPLIPPPEDLPRTQWENIPWEAPLPLEDLGVPDARPFDLDAEETTRILTDG